MDSEHPLTSIIAFREWARYTSRRDVYSFGEDRVGVSEDAYFMWRFDAKKRILITPPTEHGATVLQGWLPYLLVRPDFVVLCSAHDGVSKLCALCANIILQTELPGRCTPCRACHDRRSELVAIIRAATMSRHIHPVCDIGLCILLKLRDLALSLCAQMPGV